MRKTLAGLLLLTVVLAAFLLTDGWYDFGKSASGARLERMMGSPNWRDGYFVNEFPLYNPFFSRPERWLDTSAHAKPAEPVAAARTEPSVFETDVPLRITWFGHSIALIEIEGIRFLTDPVWSERVSPYGWIGPARWYPPTIALDDLPRVDAVLISHDHYDHLDTKTIEALANRVEQFVVPLGVGAHLEYWGVRKEKIVEIDWWDAIDVRGVTVTGTPARHASGRTFFDFDKTLWMGFALRGSDRAVYFSGDTGLFPGLKEIGNRLGPFDVTMIEVGAYGADWPDWHIGPEQAVLAHNWVRGNLLLPVHWGLFDLARHAWTEPVERTLAAAAEAGYPVITPRPGSPINPDDPDCGERWWPEVPWQSAEIEPVVATGDFTREFQRDFASTPPGTTVETCLMANLD